MAKLLSGAGTEDPRSFGAGMNHPASFRRRKRSSYVIPAPETSSQASFRRRKTGSLYLPAPESNSLNSFRRRRRQSMYLEYLNQASSRRRKTGSPCRALRKDLYYPTDSTAPATVSGIHFTSPPAPAAPFQTFLECVDWKMARQFSLYAVKTVTCHF